MARKHVVLAIHITALTLFATGCEQYEKAKTWVLAKAGQTSNDASKDSPEAGSNKDIVTTYLPVREGVIQDLREIRGSLRAANRVEIRADKRVKIGAPKVKDFANVKRGDILFEVDISEIQSKRVELLDRVRQLEIDAKGTAAQLEFAKRQFDRKSALAKKGIAAAKETEEAEKQFRLADNSQQAKKLELEKAQRELAEANTQVKTANIVAAIDGTVSRMHRGGEEVNEGTVLSVISSPGQLELAVNVDESIVTLLKQGADIQVRIDAADGVLTKGKVGQVALTAGGDGLYEVRINLDPQQASKLALREGFEATLMALVARRDKATVVPVAALQSNAGQSFLLVASREGATPVARNVRTGVQNDLEVEVVEGIKLGEFAVVATGGTR